MTAIAYEYPSDIAAIREGLARFIKAEVMPRHHDNSELLENPHHRFTPDGRTLVVPRLDGSLHLWSMDAIHRELAPLGLDWSH